MDRMLIKNLVAFCILMENNEGILDKSPDYILEKFQRFVETGDPSAYQWGLDADNTKKLQDWIERWLEPKK